MKQRSIDKVESKCCLVAYFGIKIVIHNNNLNLMIYEVKSKGVHRIYQ